MADFVDVNRQAKGQAETMATAAVISEALKDVTGIFQMLVQAAMSNPIVGAALVLWINDILLNKKVIGPNTALGIGILVYTAAGASVTSEIIQDFTKLTSIIGSTPVPALIQPTATTLVLGGAPNSQDQLNALLNLLNKK